jgi:hypothetical protein
MQRGAEPARSQIAIYGRYSQRSVMMAKAKEATSLGVVSALPDQVGRKPRRNLGFPVVL